MATAYGTNVSDTELEHLKGLTRLKTLFLGLTEVTDEGAEDFQKATDGTKCRPAFDWTGRRFSWTRLFVWLRVISQELFLVFSSLFWRSVGIVMPPLQRNTISLK
jgi:hypothetical protein